MKICLISGSMPPLKCGIGYYTSRLLDTLGQNDDVYLLTTRGLDTHPLARSTVYVDNWRVWSIPKMIKAIRSTNPDIIHIQYPAKGYRREIGINLLPLFLKLRRRKIPLVLTLHEYFGSGVLGRIRNLLTAWFVDKILVSNPYDYESLPKYLRNKATVVPIGSNIPIAKRNLKKYEDTLKKFHIENEKPVIFFGFPFANKGIEILIDAAIQGSIPVLFLCEFDKSDPYQAGLLSRIKNANANRPRLFVAGFLDDESVSQILQESEIFVLPQSFPLTAKSGTAIAAATHGMVVVSKSAESASLSLPYISDQNSVLLSSMNSSSLLEAINRIRDNSSDMKRLRSGASKLTEYFSWDSISKMHHQIYRELRK